MQGDPVRPEDEGRHRPRSGRAWEESWYLDFAAADGSLAGYVRLALRPGDRGASFWAAMVGGGPPLVAVRDDEVPPPSGRPLEVRAPGLWTELVCETPLEHWTVGLEAFGVALDDPLEAWRAERGDPWALGLDVEWEAAAACSWWPGPGEAGGPTGYSQPCLVSGDVLVGDRRLTLDGAGGVRVHLWGDRDWTAPWAWAAGRMDDGTGFLAAGDDVAVERRADGLLGAGAVMAGPAGGGPALALDPVAHAPVLVPGPGRLARALCRYGDDGGRRGYGWAERLV